MAPTRQDEMLEGGEFGLAPVDGLFQGLYLSLAHFDLFFSAPLPKFGVGQLGPDGKEISLNGREDLPDLTVVEEGPNGTQERVQLVHVSVRLDTGVVFWDAGPIEEAGFPFVACLGIDLHLRCCPDARMNLG